MFKLVRICCHRSGLSQLHISLIFFPDSKGCLAIKMTGPLNYSWLTAVIFKPISFAKLGNSSMSSYPSEILILSQTGFARQTPAILLNLVLLASISCSRFISFIAKSDNSTEFNNEPPSIVEIFSICSFVLSNLLSPSKDKSEE